MGKLKVLLVVAFAGLLACEKVIDLPLNEADQRVVIEAVLKDVPDSSYVLISRSGTVYQEEDFSTIDDATVKIYDEDGALFSFDHVEDGYYANDGFLVVPGQLYRLDVLADGQKYEAVCAAKSKPSIDSLSFLRISGQFGVPEEDTVNLISFHSVDNPDEANYYWMRIFRNGKMNSGYYLGNDLFINGSYFEAQFFGSEAKNGDTVLVEMISMDKANYNYMYGLANALSSGPISVSPANPPSNISNDALGFFGAYTTDTLSIILPY